MNKILLIVSLVITRTLVIGQAKTPSSLISKSGLIVFEGSNSNSVYEMYFVETSIKTLKSLMKNKDTLVSIILGSPGDAANNISGFKWLLDKREVGFKDDEVVIRDTNYLGYSYEDTTRLYSTYGVVKYYENRSIPMALRTKKICYGKKTVSIYSSYSVSIKSFTPTPVHIHRTRVVNPPGGSK